jgi:ribosome biogenesis GTPase
MRELALWADEAALDVAFPDIDEFAARCRFSDCRHDTEPDCAVRAAVDGGELERSRFESYRKLREEIEETDALRRRR